MNLGVSRVAWKRLSTGTEGMLQVGWGAMRLTLARTSSSAGARKIPIVQFTLALRLTFLWTSVDRWANLSGGVTGGGTRRDVWVLTVAGPGHVSSWDGRGTTTRRRRVCRLGFAVAVNYRPAGVAGGYEGIVAAIISTMHLQGRASSRDRVPIRIRTRASFLAGLGVSHSTLDQIIQIGFEVGCSTAAGAV